MRATPSCNAISCAYELGVKLARKDPRFRPVLSHACEYGDYEWFRQSQRLCLEQKPEFLPWDRKLQALAEREASPCGIRVNDARMWDVFDACVAGPIRDAFWLGWETVHGLPELHQQALMDHHRARKVPPQVLRVCYELHLPKNLSAGAEWEQLAETVFGKPSADDVSFWEMPAPASMCQQLPAGA